MIPKEISSRDSIGDFALSAGAKSPNLFPGRTLGDFSCWVSPSGLPRRWEPGGSEPSPFPWCAAPKPHRRDPRLDWFSGARVRGPRLTLSPMTPQPGFRPDAAPKPAEGSAGETGRAEGGGRTPPRRRWSRGQSSSPICTTSPPSLSRVWHSQKGPFGAEGHRWERSGPHAAASPFVNTPL
jgi:hypothetical protein